MSQYNYEALFAKNPAMCYIGNVTRKVGKKTKVSDVNAYVLFADHPYIPHRWTWNEIENCVLKEGVSYAVQDVRRHEFYEEARSYLKEQMVADGNVSYDAACKSVHDYECAGHLLVVNHNYFNGMETTYYFTFNGQSVKMTTTYNADALESDGFYGWANTHTVRLYNRTDNRYMTFCGNPKLDAVEWDGNVCKPKSKPDKLAFVKTEEEARKFFLSIIEFGRMGNLGYDDFLFEIGKSNSGEAMSYYIRAKKAFLDLNRVLGIRSYEHAGQLLNKGI